MKVQRFTILFAVIFILLNIYSACIINVHADDYVSGGNVPNAFDTGLGTSDGGGSGEEAAEELKEILTDPRSRSCNNRSWYWKNGFGL